MVQHRGQQPQRVGVVSITVRRQLFGISAAAHRYVSSADPDEM
jgi:hypothetical protein